MRKEKHTGHMVWKIGLLSLAATAGLAVGFAPAALAAEADTATTVTADPTPAAQAHTLKEEPGSHMLEWGVFGIAAGEVGGMLGMGLRQVQSEKRRQKEAAKTVIAPAPEEVPLSYRSYKKSLEGAASAL